jgi:hypothetical protein
VGVGIPAQMIVASVRSGRRTSWAMGHDAARTATTAAAANDEPCITGIGPCRATWAPTRAAVVTPKAATGREKDSSSAARKPTMPRLPVPAED